MDDAIHDLDKFRPRLMSIAYRMLGSLADAEDAVQDAYLQLQTADAIRSNEGFLIRVTTRRCIDRLRARRRMSYTGPWVPEPVETHGRDSDLADSLSQAFLLLLERLAPRERAAFLLRTVFDYEYQEIGRLIDKPEATVRQIVSRARRKLGLGERRFPSAAAQASELAERFVASCRAGDLGAVESMLTEGIEVHSDGGGKASAARVVIRGAERAARFLTGVFRKQRALQLHPTTVNGEPGLAFTQEGKVVEVMAFRIQDRVEAVYIILNPDKLKTWSTRHVD